MELSLKEGRNLLLGVGFAERINTLPAAVIQRKVNALKESHKDATPSKETEDIFNKVIESLEKGEKIVIAEGSAPAAAPKKPAKKAAEKKPAAKPPAKAAPTKPKASAAPRAVKNPAKAAAKKAAVDKQNRPGVVMHIIEILQKATEAKPLNRDAILLSCVRKFPDRQPDKMSKTILNQTSHFIKNVRGLNLQKNEKGYYIAPGKAKKKAS